MDKQLWSAVAVIVLGYLIGFYFQNRRIDDLRQSLDKRFDAVDKRFDDLKDWIRAEIHRLDQRIDYLAEKVGTMGERIEHPVVKGS